MPVPLDQDETYLPIGRSIKPHGLKGELKVILNRPEYEKILAETKTIFFSNTQWTIISIRHQPKGLLIGFKGISTANEAELLRNQVLYLKRATVLKSLLEEEAFLPELWAGWPVLNQAQESLGVVEQVLQTGGNDVIIVGKGTSEILVPVIEEYILNVDTKLEQIVVRQPEYLE